MTFSQFMTKTLEPQVLSRVTKNQPCQCVFYTLVAFEKETTNGHPGQSPVLLTSVLA